MNSISTPPIINSFTRVEDENELSREELDSLARLLAGMIYQNLKAKKKKANCATQEKASTDVNTSRDKQ